MLTTLTTVTCVTVNAWHVLGTSCVWKNVRYESQVSRGTHSTYLSLPPQVSDLVADHYNLITLLPSTTSKGKLHSLFFSQPSGQCNSPP